MSSEILDVFIGLISIYLVLSLVVTALGEGVSSWGSYKGRVARDIVTSLVGKAIQADIYAHENILRLSPPRRFPRGKRLPSYIPAEVLVETLLDVFITQTGDQGGGAGQATLTPASLNRALMHPLPEGSVDKWKKIRAVLNRLWQEAEGDLGLFREKLVRWFDMTADRSYGWFKRRLSFALLLIAIVVAGLLNADTLQMFERLSSDSELRQQFVDKGLGLLGQKEDWCKASQLEGAACDKTFAESAAKESQTLSCEIQGLAEDCSRGDLARSVAADLLPVLGGETILQEKARIKNVCVSAGDSATKGKECKHDSILAWGFFKFIGLLLTAAAISLGAPFWFELLRKVVQIRGAIGTTTQQAPAPKGKAGAPEAPGETVAPKALSTIVSQDVAAEERDSLEDFEHTRFGYDVRNLYWNARLSGLAYSTGGEAEAICEELGAQCRFIENKLTDTQCIVVTTPMFACIAFRGSEAKLADWLTDVRLKPKIPAWDPKAKYLVHGGFHDALVSVWDDVIGALNKQGVFAANLPIWFTGHSLGGALAVLGAMRLQHGLPDRPTQSTIAGIHTYGQPRVGDVACATMLDQLFPNRFFRSINQRDVVARVPLPRSPDVLSRLSGEDQLKVYDFAHAGRVIYFNDLGRALMDPPLWYRKLDGLAVAPDLEGVKDAIKQAAGDHAVQGYIKLHLQLLGA